MPTPPADQVPQPTLPHAGDDPAHPVSQPEEERADNSEGAASSPLENLARQHQEGGLVASGAPRALSILDDLRSMGTFLRSVNAHFRARPAQEPLSYAGEWMLDNFYLVEQALRQAREDMPPRFYRELPRLASGPLQGYPRIYALAQELVVNSAAHLDLERIKRFVSLYEDIAPLGIGELWALSAMLRLATLEALCQALARITGLARDSALPEMALLATRDDEIVANCVLSLQALSIQDWQTFIESISRVEQVLREDPSGVYARMDRQTRDRYRKVVEQVARATGQDEPSVARAAIRLAQDQAPEHETGIRAPDTARTRHVGFYLVDVGRAQLEAQLGYRMSWSERVRRWAMSHPTFVYLGSIWLLTLLALGVGVSYAARTGGTLLQSVGTALLLLVPALSASVSLVNWLVTLLVPPRVLPKMDFEEGIPGSCKTLVVVPSLLTSDSEVRSLLRQLELHYVRNQDPHLHFALLTDLPDSPGQHGPEGERLVQQAASGIQALNEKYPRATPGPFYLFHRDPRWNPREERWMGWERKRGKLHQLNLMLRGGAETAFSVQTGDPEALREIRFVITLDADTIMPREAAQRLVATLAHPLNRAELDPRNGSVLAGYSVLQPAIHISATSANLSRFTRVFAGDVGLDLYTRAVSNAYQDLFGEGIYVGKGIYDVDAFERSLAGRMPENAVLSHDLLEGVMGRVALVTDIVFYEDYPPQYFVYVRRSRRWIRGDWQLLPWLFPRVPSVGGQSIPNNLSLIDRWKIFDNLRRSLLSPGLIALLLAGWIWLPGSPLAWTLAAVLSLAVPVLTGLLVGSLQALGSSHWRAVLNGFRVGVLRWLLALVFLLYETLVTLGGILTTLVRLFVTRKGLLQWTSYADTVRTFAGRVTWQQMLMTSVATSALGFLVSIARPSALWIAMPVLVAWLLSPEIAYWISRPIRFAPLSLTSEERHRLRRLARRTWLFFEQFVGPEDHWLPPDHFQEAPLGIVAHSTSPTDIGLLLLSTLAAYDFGYIGAWELSARLQDTLDSMRRLETYQGHLLNWYDTRTLEPLLPRYVSTVDSGNLIGSLRALWQGCEALPREPVLRWRSWEGLLDTLGMLDEIVRELQSSDLKQLGTPLRARLAQIRQQVLATREDPAAWHPLLERLTGVDREQLRRTLMSLTEAGGLGQHAEALQGLSHGVDRVENHLNGLRRETDQLCPWLMSASQPPQLPTEPDAPPAMREAWLALKSVLPDNPRLEELAAVYETAQTRLAELQDQLDEADTTLAGVQEARDWCTHFAEKLSAAAGTSAALLDSLKDVVQCCEQYFEQTDFRFLFDKQRQLFHIGYNVTAEKLDANYYDLLESEARIASLITIAEDQVPQSHWLHLGRPFTQLDGTHALLSWGGTMFEYMMPALLMRSYPGTFLAQSNLAAVDVQIAYGNHKQVPWGISESGYYAFDAAENYQYRSFGVPGLGLKRGLEEDLVVAPYASLLALPLRPRRVLENIGRLSKLQMLGTYGLYEAVDFSPGRLPPGESHAVVRSYMSHHQGMILVSLLNYLQGELMVRRFHADPLIRSVDLLLQEKVPEQAPAVNPQRGEPHAARREPAHRENLAMPWQVPAAASTPQVHVLSNGRYSALITSAGAGYSSWQGAGRAAGIDLTRWRADPTCENWGTWIYVQDLDSDELWSAGVQPVTADPGSSDVHFYPHMAEFRRSDHGIGLTMEVTVAPEDDVEIRRISLTNHTDRLRHIALTSYGEVILSMQSADASNPAFNKMFVESEYLPESNSLLFRRRPRSKSELPVFLVHACSVSPGHRTTGAYETDRGRFLGRGQSLSAPAALKEGTGALSGTTGATLDPIMAVRQELHLLPHASAQVSFVTLAASSRDQAVLLARRYHGGRMIFRTFDLARARAEAEMRPLDLTSTDLERAQRLLSALVYPSAALRAPAATLAANTKGQAGLWPFSISGDYPIMLVRLHTLDDLTLVREALRAHRYWRNRHVQIDLVIVNEQGSTYGQELSGRLQRALAEQSSENWLNRRGGIFIVYADQLDEADRVLLESAARVVLDGSAGALSDQLQPVHQQPAPLPPIMPSVPASAAKPSPGLARPADLLFDNKLGGFSPDGREYVTYLQRGQWTPAPWINVIANPEFGFVVSESGSGYTWSGNSSENRLTPWTNDPLRDPPGEALYLRDEETAEVWSATPLPCRAPQPYIIRHGAGYSTFEHDSHGLKQRLRLFAVHDHPVKVLQLRLENTWDRTRRVTATFYAEWVLGVTRDMTQQYVVCEFDSGHEVLLARNPYNTEFAGRVAFAAAGKRLHGLTADRTEFLGRLGDAARPAALERIGLTGTVRPGIDPCAALQLHIDLKPGESEEVVFLLGQAADREEALRLVEQYRGAEQVESAWKAVIESWDKLLGAVQVKTPDPAMDLMLNRWLLYPALSCRMWGRSAFYQSSGAFGFRDQLQDAMALVHAAPQLTRAHLLEAARHQFEAGDVLHWWHPPSGRGVRTRSSDDLLWLPFCAAHYVATTGDTSVLDERIPFLKAAPLTPAESERYGEFGHSDEAFSLYQHCLRALEKGTTAGAHGLPLMQSGDWNDGMNLVGIEGRGESAWLGWFLGATLTRFADICASRGEPAQADAYRRRAAELGKALEAAWDGAWYRRAYYDDGTPLGSSANDECQIDSIAQSWAILSGLGEQAHSAQAMQSVVTRLVRPAEQLLLLLAPPFDQTPKDPGYIRGYPPGIRENGGQYTHASLWTVLAFALQGQGDEAERLFHMLNPIHHSDSPEAVARYRVEPYAVAADVYSGMPHAGRGGWTWYTGSNGWMYRVGLEAILGIQREGGTLVLDPCIPRGWPTYQVTYQAGDAVLEIRVDNPSGVQRGVRQVTLDGKVLPDNRVPVPGDTATHQVHVLMGPQAS